MFLAVNGNIRPCKALYIYVIIFNFQIDVNEKLILDMTFGSGNNSTTILNCASAKNISAKIVTSTSNFSDHQISKDEALLDSRLQPLPMIST